MKIYNSKINLSKEEFIYKDAAGNEIRFIEGTEQADTIDGGNGNDELSGNGGNDIITGGVGGDMIRPGSEVIPLTVVKMGKTLTPRNCYQM